jgi:hemerythrin-like domain-containing protein
VNDRDVATYMTEDQFEVSERIRKLLENYHKLDSDTTEYIQSKIRRHIYIEESILFPTLQVRLEEDVDYLEKEHGRILASLEQLKKLSETADQRAVLEKLYDLLQEHNSYEESFVYDYFLGKGLEMISTITSPPDSWKAKYE